MPELDLSSNDKLLPYIRHTFSAGLPFEVKRLEINGRKGRRVVCVVAQDMMRYRIFDLDSGSVDSEGVGVEKDDEGIFEGEESDMAD